LAHNRLPQEKVEVYFLISAEQYRRAQPTLEGVEEFDPSLYDFDDAELTDVP